MSFGIILLVSTDGMSRHTIRINTVKNRICRYVLTVVNDEIVIIYHCRVCNDLKTVHEATKSARRAHRFKGQFRSDPSLPKEKVAPCGESGDSAFHLPSFDVNYDSDSCFRDNQQQGGASSSTSGGSVALGVRD